MKAYELQAKLTYLTLCGYEDGEYQFIGDSKAWATVEAIISLNEDK